MKYSSILLLAAGFLICAPCRGEEAEVSNVPAEESHSVGHKVVMYIPNRILDLIDIVRLRVRFGPGIAVDARVTQLAAVHVGAYDTVYLGLPGPRNRRTPKLPVGFERQSGAPVKVVDSTDNDNFGPDYGPAEIDLGAQVLIVGVDAGVEPFELLDFVAGLFFIDLRNDDL